MYIVKNAFRCIGRAKARNILIGVIVLVIAVASCLGLSIRQAAESARASTMAGMSVTATIAFDRTSAMQDMAPGGNNSGFGGREPGQGFDRDSFANMMGAASELSLEEYRKYAGASSVADFYYTMTIYVNGTEDFLPVSTSTSGNQSGDAGMPDGFRGGMQGGMGGIFGMNSDFTVVGYSADAAMTAFQGANSTASVSTGRAFAEGEASYECIISEELAAYNGLAVGDTIEITNPNNEEEVYTLTVTGFYTDIAANGNSFSRFGATATDPANSIYMSYATLASIADASAIAGKDTALAGTLSATYVFADVQAYEAFTEEVRALGLDDSYTVSSQDVTAFENSMTPLNTLSTMAGWFLLVILVIGAVILIVLNLFNVRERKYEIGVLTAMGMKKGKVALQFLTEIFVVTLAAVIIGAGIGGAAAVPVTNALLEGQVTAQNNQADRTEQNFGRGPGGMQGMGNMPDMGGQNMGGRPDDDRGGFFAEGMANAANYIREVDSAMNLTVVLQMLLIGVLLTLAAGAVSMLVVMRYEPLKILANRD